MRIVAAQPQHLEEITAIYGQAVREGTGTFEELAPSLDDMRARFEAILGAGYVWLVAIDHGEVVGYGYLGPFRARSAYRFTVEDSVYVRHDRQGKGIGGALLQALIDAARAQNREQILALIGDSANLGSIALHRRLGFETTGIMRGVGFKFERWLDVVIMHLTVRNENGKNGK